MKAVSFVILIICTCGALSAQTAGPPAPLKDGADFRADTLPRFRHDPWLAEDKARHFYLSMILTGAAGWIIHRRFSASQNTGRFWGAGAVLSLGIIKECLDHRAPGRFFSWRDAAADLAGVITGGALLVW